MSGVEHELYFYCQIRLASANYLGYVSGHATTNFQTPNYCKSTSRGHGVTQTFSIGHPIKAYTAAQLLQSAHRDNIANWYIFDPIDPVVRGLQPLSIVKMSCGGSIIWLQSDLIPSETKLKRTVKHAKKKKSHLVRDRLRRVDSSTVPTKFGVQLRYRRHVDPRGVERTAGISLRVYANG